MDYSKTAGGLTEFATHEISFGSRHIGRDDLQWMLAR